MKRYRIKAGGGGEHPDLDYETDDYPKDLLSKYEFVTVSLQVPVSREAVLAGLTKAS